MKHVLGKEARLAVAWWPIQRPLPYAKNPRLVPEAAIVKVAASLTEYGWRQPLVVDKEGVIIVGHTRLLAAQRLGLTQVPVHVAGDLTPAQAKAYRLTDNRSAQETSWDYELLPLEIGDLADADYDLDVLGFDPDELASLLAQPTAGLCDPDEVPEPPAEPISKPGDLWLLGAHRLLCGDATKAKDVRRLMNGERAALMATDPPYLVDYTGGCHPQSWGNGGKRAGRDVATKRWDAYREHDQAVAFYAAFLKAALKQALTADAAVYQCYAILRSEFIWQAWREVGLLPHQVVVWKKSRAVLTHSWFLWDFEPLMVGWPQGHQPQRKPPAETKAVWEIASTEGNEAAISCHPTVKPVELIRRPIEWHTTPGGLLYEPFLGSGTALIAAEEMGRVCYALELSPSFVDVAVTRWQNFTGGEALRDGTLDQG
jgi:DNA modification methylase